jgi:hypothetical protein
VIFLSEHLALNPHSRVFAIRGGAQELQGWDAATVVAVRTHNLIASLILGLSKAPAEPGMFIEYPGITPEEQQPTTLAEFSVSGFNKFMYGEG